MALCAAACGGGGTTTDAAVPHDTNASTEDTGPTSSTLPAPTQGLGSTPADLSCVGTSTAPAVDPALVPITMTMLSFGQDDHAADTRVCFCPENVLSPEALAGTGCGSTCQDQTSGATGEISVMAHAGGWYAYRVFAHTGVTSRTTFLDSVQINETAPMAGGMVDGNAVSALTANTIPAAELIARTPGTTTIAGRVLDCDGAIRGAIIHAFHADGSEIPEGVNVGDPHYRFFNGTEMPDANATFTAGDGLYIVANVTPAAAGEVIRVETWANVDGVDSRIGCEAISIFANGISIVNVGPLRTDYPSGHPCE